MRVLLLAAFALLLGSCSGKQGVIAGGEPKTGKNLVAWYGCGSCHEIPGMPGATGRVAPPLQRIARRAYITGSVPNTPANLMRWIREPRKVDARTIMPDMGISEEHSRDITAFLYTLD